jgi:hypothetical protein
VSQCFRCETLRDEFFPLGGDWYSRSVVAYRRYRYPDGYHVEGRVERGVFTFAASERFRTEGGDM